MGDMKDARPSSGAGNTTFSSMTEPHASDHDQSLIITVLHSCAKHEKPFNHVPQF